ncbi:MAG TPA: hypothetical protein VNJ01_17625 [Bacteriovoracaceae bacterium]|nr:hypothetical protein [Bacteriovoracaceae bacterium]
MKNMNRVLSAFVILTVSAGCGGDSKKKSLTGPRQEERGNDVPVEEVSVEGTYLATMKTLNVQVNGTLDTASATIKRVENKLYAYTRLFAGKPATTHRQAVYMGTRCPTAADDTNGDTFIDIGEANAVVGKIIMPLDSDISSQDSGSGYYTTSDLSGFYQWERITSFDKWLADLRKEDKKPDDNIVKLPADIDFNFQGHVVMIQGVDNATALPPTVGTERRYLPQHTLPIACGIYNKVVTQPGVLYVDQIPGEVAAVDEAADVPAPPGAGEIAGTGTVVDTTTTNDSDENGSTDVDENEGPEIDIDVPDIDLDGDGDGF